MNLLQETKEDIEKSGHTFADVIFIGSVDSGHCCTIAEFHDLADIEYDNGFGGQEVASDLKIVFSDGSSMWRGENDGSEWWEYSVPFEDPKKQKKIKKIIGGMWNNLQDLNEG